MCVPAKLPCTHKQLWTVVSTNSVQMRERERERELNIKHERKKCNAHAQWLLHGKKIAQRIRSHGQVFYFCKYFSCAFWKYIFFSRLLLYAVAAAVVFFWHAVKFVLWARVRCMPLHSKSTVYMHFGWENCRDRRQIRMITNARATAATANSSSISGANRAIQVEMSSTNALARSNEPRICY